MSHVAAGPCRVRLAAARVSRGPDRGLLGALVVEEQERQAVERVVAGLLDLTADDLELRASPDPRRHHVADVLALARLGGAEGLRTAEDGRGALGHVVDASVRVEERDRHAVEFLIAGLLHDAVDDDEIGIPANPARDVIADAGALISLCGAEDLDTRKMNHFSTLLGRYTPHLAGISPPCMSPSHLGRSGASITYENKMSRG